MRSGFENLIYLVESFNSAALHDEHSQQIYTAKSQVQVSSGIALYETSHLNDSLNFLTNRNAIINEIWSVSPFRLTFPLLIDSILSRGTLKFYLIESSNEQPISPCYKKLIQRKPLNIKSLFNHSLN